MGSSGEPRIELIPTEVERAGAAWRGFAYVFDSRDSHTIYNPYAASEGDHDLGIAP